MDVAGRHDSNRFLFDNTWVDGGLRLSMNLFRLASIPSVMRAGEALRHIAYGNAQAAWGRIFNSLGYDIDPPAPDAGVAEVAASIERSLARWQRMAIELAAPRGAAPAGQGGPTAAVSPR